MLLFSAKSCLTLQPHGLQHARLPCPSLSVKGYSNSCSLSVMPSYHLILHCPLFLLPSVFPSFGVFSTELSLCIRSPKYWSFSFRICYSNEYSGFISFRVDWFYLLANFNKLIFFEILISSILIFLPISRATPTLTIRNVGEC